MLKKSLLLLALICTSVLFLGSPRLAHAAATCSAGAFNLVGIRNGQEIITGFTADDQLLLHFNGNLTTDFSIGVYDIALFRQRADGGSVIPDGLGLMTSVVGGNGRLHWNGQVIGDIGPFNVGQLGGNYYLEIHPVGNTGAPLCQIPFNIPAAANQRDETLYEEFNLCSQIPEYTADGARNPAIPECEACLTQTQPPGIWTSLGCIETGPTQMITAIMRIGLGMAGGVALLIILSSGLMLTLSQGEPKQTAEARDRLTAAIVGLLFILFSVTILQFIGVNLLQIPGFASSNS